MSHSMKKHPVISHYFNGKKFIKRVANKVIRKLDVFKSISSGCAYKKYYQQYNICDFKFFVCSEKQFYNLNLDNYYKDYKQYLRLHIKK